MHADWATFPPKEAQETQARQARRGVGKLPNRSCYDRYTTPYLFSGYPILANPEWERGIRPIGLSC
jgi:hypothetical protein